MTARETWTIVSRVTAAIVGGLALALAAVVFLTLAVPAPKTLGVALAVPLALPLWLAAMCPGFLARGAFKSWALYIVGTGLFALGAWLLG